MSDYTTMLSANNFQSTIQKYCAEHGWAINRVVEDGLALVFDGTNGIPVIVTVKRKDTYLTFSTPTNLYYHEVEDIPHRLSTTLLHISSVGGGYWCIEKLKDEFNYLFHYDVETSVIDSEYFGQVVRRLVQECDEINVTGESSRVLTATNFKSDVEDFCGNYGWSLEDYGSDNLLITLEGDSGDELKIHMRRDGLLIHFRALANLRYSDPIYIPDSVFIGLMQRNSCSKSGFWSLEKLDLDDDSDPFAFAFRYAEMMGAISEELFGELIKFIAKECDDVNQMDEDIVMPSE
jgi:hypothetical protein